MSEPAEMVEIRSTDDALRLLDQWVESYDALLMQFRRLEIQCWHTQHDLESLQFLLRHLDPFLPPNMQNPEWVRSHFKVYAQIAEHLEFDAVPF